MLFIPSDILHPVRCNPANWQAVAATYALESDCHVPILILFQPVEGTDVVKVPFMILADPAGVDNYYFIDYNSVPVPAPLCADPNACLSVICSRLEHDMEFENTMRGAYDHASQEEA